MAIAPLYQRGQTDRYRISRTKIENHIRCPRCSVLDLRHGVKAPSGPPFTINSAVDTMLKREFDIYREAQNVHPVVAAAGFDLVPFAHPDLDKWRHNFTGVQASTNFFNVYGAVDDIWMDAAGTLYVVDYKSTGRAQAVTELGEGGFYDSYRRQLEVYQWLLRQNGFAVSDTGFWVYCTATQKAPVFANVLDFEVNLVQHSGTTDWIEPKLTAMKADLDAERLPEPHEGCEVCRYYEARMEAESLVFSGLDVESEARIKSGARTRAFGD